MFLVLMLASILLEEDAINFGKLFLPGPELGAGKPDFLSWQPDEGNSDVLL